MGDGRRMSPELSMREVERIATAFELGRDEVLEDAALVASWQARQQDLTELLKNRHSWDASMAPVYVAWLRGDGASLSD
jgi:hypothetical protein